MSATKRTQHYELPVYQADDKLNILVDGNGAMQKIDEVMFSIAGAEEETNSRVGSLETLTEQTKNTVDSHTLSITNINEELDGLDDRTTNAVAALNNLTNRVDNIDSQTDAIELTANNALNKADNAEELAKSAESASSTAETNAAEAKNKADANYNVINTYLMPTIDEVKSRAEANTARSVQNESSISLLQSQKQNVALNNAVTVDGQQYTVIDTLLPALADMANSNKALAQSSVGGLMDITYHPPLSQTVAAQYLNTNYSANGNRVWQTLNIPDADGGYYVGTDFMWAGQAASHTDLAIASMVLELQATDSSGGWYVPVGDYSKVFYTPTDLATVVTLSSPLFRLKGNIKLRIGYSTALIDDSHATEIYTLIGQLNFFVFKIS